MHRCNASGQTHRRNHRQTHTLITVLRCASEGGVRWRWYGTRATAMVSGGCSGLVQYVVYLRRRYGRRRTSAVSSRLRLPARQRRRRSACCCCWHHGQERCSKPRSLCPQAARTAVRSVHTHVRRRHLAASHTFINKMPFALP